MPYILLYEAYFTIFCNIFLFGLQIVAVTRKDICWKSEEIPLSLTDKSIDGLQFEQNGFVLSAVTSHKFSAVRNICIVRKYDNGAIF